MPLNYNCTVCLRLDDDINRRISRVLGRRHSSKSRFIRAAIEKALLEEEGHARLCAEYGKIDWG
jgi:predicted transcriptional regulator